MGGEGKNWLSLADFDLDFFEIFATLEEVTGKKEVGTNPHRVKNKVEDGAIKDAFGVEIVDNICNKVYGGGGNEPVPGIFDRAFTKLPDHGKEDKT